MLEDAVQIRDVRRRDDVDHPDVGAPRQQPVRAGHGARPATGAAARPIVELRRRPVERDVDEEALDRREPVRNGVVDEPAVRVQRRPDARRRERVEHLERQLAAQ